MIETVAPTAPNKSITGNYRPAMVAGFSGWLLDAFDFFLMTFCLTAIAKDFHKSDVQIALVITMTLAFRPVGAFVLGGDGTSARKQSLLRSSWLPPSPGEAIWRSGFARCRRYPP